MSANILTPEFRASYPNVFRPGKPMEEGGKAKYGITMLFSPNADLTALRAAANEAAREFFGAKLQDPEFVKKLRSPFRDQGEKAKTVDGKRTLPEAHADGAFFVNATSEQKPGLVDENVQDIIEERKFYPGCFARATVRFFGYDQRGNRGVGCGLQNVQFLRDGESLGGRTRPSDDFAPVAGAASPAKAAGGGAGASVFG